MGKIIQFVIYICFIYLCIFFNFSSSHRNNNSFLNIADLSLISLHAAARNSTNIVVIIQPNLNITINGKGFTTFTVLNPENCLVGGSNLCCQSFNSSMFDFQLEDKNSLPICGVYITQTMNHEAGLGHWLSEYTPVVIESLQYPVERLKTKIPIGHYISRKEGLNY